MNITINSNYDLCRDNVITLLKKIKQYLFNNLFDYETQFNDNVLLNSIIDLLKSSINIVNKMKGLEIDSDLVSKEIITEFPLLIKDLKTDLEASFDGDPAAFDIEEIALTYPGFLATSIYRIANIIYKKNIPYIPRIMTEYAHSKTGIDIHPGATIGNYFFIDHGTGTVIGQTATLGHHVRIYQGVTLGALSLGRGHTLNGTKRHPSIGNYVTIYAGASILGGNTIIGNNVTIGSNCFITDSIPENTIIRLKPVDHEIRQK